MSKVLGQVLTGVAVLALLHAAFSTYEHLSTLKAVSRPTSSLPLSIIAEAIISLLLFVPGIALASDKLEDVTYRGELAKRNIDDADARMAFMVPSRRGKALFGDR